MPLSAAARFCLQARKASRTVQAWPNRSVLPYSSCYVFRATHSSMKASRAMMQLCRLSIFCDDQSEGFSMEGRVPPLLRTWVPPPMKMLTGFCHGGVCPS